MTLLDLLGTLLLLGSVLLVLVLLPRLAVLALRGRWSGVRRGAGGLGLYLAGYGVILVTVALVMPRERRAPGERECFDDWCAAGIGVEPAAGDEARCADRAGTRVWVATVEVSSDAKRVRQRALDARALLEDAGGREYAACGSPLGAHVLADELGPGEAFQVREPFRLPAAAVPAGVVISHGGFPGILIIGEDQSLFHRRTLLGVAVRGG
ncbi:MAG TPA: hypothetical protein VMF70_05710 [Gemmatimonadales bacterium]|nr:hypothetical protein [Gemmatimonadales bacterium]